MLQLMRSQRVGHNWATKQQLLRDSTYMMQDKISQELSWSSFEIMTKNSFPPIKINKLNLKSLQIINAREDVEKQEPSYTVGGNVNLYSHYAEQYGGSSNN